MVKLPFFTVGHSNRGLEEFVELLRSAAIGLVADIRKLPRSRAHPQFNQDTLPGALAACNILYDYIPALGGRRAKSRTSSEAVSGFWTNQSFRNYADYALTPEFRAGLEHLRHEGRERRCTVMCSEAVWWRCHRRIVADYLIAHGETVFHIMGRTRLEPARLTSGAVVQAGGVVIYPALKPSQLD